MRIGEVNEGHGLGIFKVAIFISQLLDVHVELLDTLLHVELYVISHIAGKLLGQPIAFVDADCGAVVGAKEPHVKLGAVYFEHLGGPIWKPAYFGIHQQMRHALQIE